MCANVTHAQSGKPAKPSGDMQQAARLFLELLSQHFNRASLVVIDGDHQYSFGPAEGPALVLRVNRPDFYTHVLLQGNLGLGESYMSEGFDVDDGRLPELLIELLKMKLDLKTGHNWRFVLRYGAIRLKNLIAGNVKNVRCHYDIGEELFDTFLLDRYHVYSCGYAQSPDADIETLQCEKLERICQKLELARDLTLLDIGCGEGGLLVHAALHFGVRGIGITNSRAHYERANAIINLHGLRDKIQVRLQNFQAISGQYDRIVSVGMLEHLREHAYPHYFKKIADALLPGGRALVHTIGCNTHINRHDPFIQRYIFPGSSTPKLSRICSLLELNCLAILDVENLVRHYAVTSRRWLEAFRTNAHRLDPARYEISFKRMWEYYLCCGIAAATAGEVALYQVLFTNDYHAPYRYQRI
ncbi:class I SAM-dependent methyltransferase [Pseudomonas sp.]|uniref:class I SAM-dependent methyltransferase n=1 Tax=Pseudomonas sp. TaxID=306 RepID=UPI00235524D6|nr:class I SAM-dependent methyltransferase [Pseudomonas sp.]